MHRKWIGSWGRRQNFKPVLFLIKFGKVQMSNTVIRNPHNIIRCYYVFYDCLSSVISFFGNYQCIILYSNSDSLPQLHRNRVCWCHKTKNVAAFKPHGLYFASGWNLVLGKPLVMLKIVYIFVAVQLNLRFELFSSLGEIGFCGEFNSMSDYNRTSSSFIYFIFRKVLFAYSKAYLIGS